MKRLPRFSIIAIRNLGKSLNSSVAIREFCSTLA